jgi:FKBP-type peptidyl-prolyl cis-trans isomerase (trigger factor)
MNLSVRETGNWQHTLEIEVPTEEVERRLEETALGIQRRVSLPGFRKGRVPLDMVRQQFADAVEQEFLDAIVPRATGEALTEAKLDPVVPALVRNLHFTPGQPLRFEALVDVRPTIEARDYRDLPLTRHTRPVTDATVDGMMSRLREESAVFEDLARPAERGDFVQVDSVRVDPNGRRLNSTRARGLRIHLGAPDLLPDLENGLLGAVEGQERTIDVQYPADYPHQELAGRPARYLVRVRKIQAQKLRELDDTFAREVFHLDSIEAFGRVRENLEGRSTSARGGRRRGGGGRADPPQPPGTPGASGAVDAGAGDPRGHQGADPGRDAASGAGTKVPAGGRALAQARSDPRRGGPAGIAGRERRRGGPGDRPPGAVRSAPGGAFRAHYQSSERRAGLKETLRERKAMDWVLAQAKIHDEVATDAPLVVPATR